MFQRHTPGQYPSSAGFPFQLPPCQVPALFLQGYWNSHHACYLLSVPEMELGVQEFIGEHSQDNTREGVRKTGLGRQKS